MLVVTILVSALGHVIVPLAGLAIAVGFLVRLYYRHRRNRLVREFRQAHGAAGKDLLLVFTDSPHWRSYIEERWLSTWGGRAVVLNRSRPWTHEQLEARLWVNFAGDSEHTPLAIVIPPRGRPTVIRFWKAFRDYKHGKEGALREAEKSLARALGYRSS